MERKEAGGVIVRGNALRLPLRDESVDLVVTSPPYFALRSYRDGGKHYDGQIGSEPTPQAFLEALWAVMAECWRVLKPSGSVFVNLGDKRVGSGGHNNANLGLVSRWGTLPHKQRQKSNRMAERDQDENESRQWRATRRNAPDRYNQAAFGRPKSRMLLPHRFAIGCEDGLADPEGIGWVVRSDLVWSKPNGLPESVTDRCRDSHEYVFMLTKAERYFSAVDEVREPYTPGSESRYVAGFNPTKRAVAGASHNAMDRSMAAGDAGPTEQNPLGKLPGSVWTIPSEPLHVPDWAKARYELPDHFAAFPSELVRRIVLGWSPSGICVECGEGRRPVVAKAKREPNDRLSLATRARTPTATGSHVGSTLGYNAASAEATITGHTCACPDASAPTRQSVVLDPFAGTGTVSGVARALGRVGIGVDLSSDWFLTEGRGRFSKVYSRTDAERQGALAL